MHDEYWTVPQRIGEGVGGSGMHQDKTCYPLAWFVGDSLM